MAVPCKATPCLLVGPSGKEEGWKGLCQTASRLKAVS